MTGRGLTRVKRGFAVKFSLGLMSFSYPALKPRLLFSTLQILTSRLRCLISVLFS